MDYICMKSVRYLEIIVKSAIIVLGFIFSILCLAPIVFIGDPTDSPDQTLRTLTVYIALIASFTIGSLSVGAITTPIMRDNEHRIFIILVGMAILLFSLFFFKISFEIIHSDISLALFPISLITAYIGGGLMITGFLIKRPS